MSPPSVSVVVPTRNRADLLPAVLAALAAQDFSGYEVIVVDDGSTDETPGLLAAWSGDGRKVVRVEDGKGSYAARNAGWLHSQGEIVAFTDDDCLPAPGWLSALVHSLRGEAVGAQGQTLAEPDEITPFTHQIDQREPGPPYRTCNVAYRRSTLERLGGFDESFRWYADNIFGIRARQLGSIAWAPNAIVRHPPRARAWRDRSTWIARFDADRRHREELRLLHAEPIAPPRSVLPVLLWVVRPLVKQSLFHLRYAVRHPVRYFRGLGPMARDKVELLAALGDFYRPEEALRAGEALPRLPEIPLVSVVIVTRDRPGLLEAALRAIRRQTWERCEIVVVDHAGSLSPPGEGRLVRAPGVTLGAARQAGVDATSGAIVAFTDDDCIPHPDWLEQIVNAFRSHPEWCGVQGRTVAAPGPIGRHAIDISRPNRLYQTCNMAYRRDTLLAVDGFDTGFEGWFEDTAVGARVLCRGPIGFAPGAVVTHQAVLRRPMTLALWSALLRDERRLATLYPRFYRRTRGPSVWAVVVVRWLLGSPVKTVLRELPRARQDPAGYGRLVRILLKDRAELVRALIGKRDGVQ